VPPEYYSTLDPQTGRRVDTDERPELSRGCVEFVAPSEYMVRPPAPPVYFFLIDVGYASVSSGVLYMVTETIKRLLNGGTQGGTSMFPGHPRTRIGIITFDSTLHFYNLRVSPLLFFFCL
jgi:protein transport protein SEC24